MMPNGFIQCCPILDSAARAHVRFHKEVFVHVV